MNSPSSVLGVKLFRPFAIKVGSVLSLRERVIKLALAESRHAELRRAVAASEKDVM